MNEAGSPTPARRPSVTRNVVANFVGMTWSAVLNLALVPVYLRLLGVESYGLVGIFATIQAALMLLDFGLSPTMSREMACARLSTEQSQDARDLARTLEIGYLALAPIIAVSLAALAPVIAAHWVGSTHLTTSSVTSAIIMMGVAAGCQWPISFYGGGLRGLQEQVRFNVINIIMASLRYGGAALIVWKVSPTVSAFFIWQAAASAVHTILLYVAFWTSMPRRDLRPQVRLTMLRRVWRFAAGVSGISLAGLVISQADKVVVSGMLSLEDFGYYSLASVVAQSLASLAVPITIGVLPVFTNLSASGDWLTLQRVYHRSAQAMTVTVASVGLVLVFFASEILVLWTGSAVTSNRVHTAMSLLVIGSMVNAAQAVPYAFLIANGLTRVPLVVSAIVAVVAFPALLFFVNAWGTTGACISWLIFNLFTVVPIAMAAHGRMLEHARVTWYLSYAADTVLPLLGALVPVVIARFLVSPGMSRGALAFTIAGIGLTALAGAILVAPAIRPVVLARLGGALRRRRTREPGRD